jgi:transcriptional regulator with XRE-family HTH domain
MYSGQPILGDESSFKTGAVQLNTSSNVKTQLLANLKADPEYRKNFVAERIFARLPLKIRFMRGDKTQAEIAQIAGKAQTWISKLEDPNYGKFTLKTLLEVAAVYDVGLEVDFVPFSHLLDEITTVSPDSFVVPSFGEEDEHGVFRGPQNQIPPTDQVAWQQKPSKRGGKLTVMPKPPEENTGIGPKNDIRAGGMR